MLELIHTYSGIFAIIVYSLILFLILKFRKPTVKEEEPEEEEQPQPVSENVSRLDPNDEDAVVASLIASIEYRNEVKKDVRIVSVREVR
ncbi:MAG: hypothetical protein IJG59_06295 [Erysipelotrichaceae bacterium]|nr:hypothetical protein [Erysipelotrichaceae bacterium]